MDDVSLSDDKRTLTLFFVGASASDSPGPCGATYTAEAEIVDGELEVAVRERESTITFPPSEITMVCTLVGYQRTLTVTLDAPYEKAVVHDRSGYTFFVAAPEGLADLAALPAEWRLVDAQDLPESRTGRWERTYARTKPTSRQSSVGRLYFYQAFNAPANVTGNDVQPSVEVNSRNASVWTDALSGEIVISWSLGGDGLAIVANEADFTIDELIALAESAELPN